MCPILSIVSIDTFRVCVDGQSQTVVPTSIRTCVTSQSCVTGPWSEWSQDQEECDPEGGEWVKRMVRRRSIERLPHGVGGAPCPHLKEYKPLLRTIAIPLNGSTVCRPR